MILMRYFGPTGAAYACAETAVRQFIATTQLPFLPTPMGKGVVSDAHKLCVAAARSRYVSDVISTHIIFIGHTLVNYLYTLYTDECTDKQVGYSQDSLYRLRS